MRCNCRAWIIEIKQSALDAGYCDAVKTDEDDYPYMAVVTFFADHYDVEEDDDMFEVAV